MPLNNNDGACGGKTKSRNKEQINHTYFKNFIHPYFSFHECLSQFRILYLNSDIYMNVFRGRFSKLLAIFMSQATIHHQSIAAKKMDSVFFHHPPPLDTNRKKKWLWKANMKQCALRRQNKKYCSRFYE